MPGLRQLLIVTMMLLTTGFVSAKGFDEGIEYIRIKPPVPTNSGNKVEVVEMFWYGCPHCYQFEPKVNAWKKNLPANVEFIHIPAVFPNRPSWELHARAYYAAELLGILDKLHTPLFDAMHKENKKLNSKEALAKFAAKHGADKNEFYETMDSFGVSMKVNRAIDLTQRYGIDGVPTMVIDGKYRTTASLTNGQAGMLKVVDFLIKKETNTPKK